MKENKQNQIIFSDIRIGVLKKIFYNIELPHQIFDNLTLITGSKITKIK